MKESLAGTLKRVNVKIGKKLFSIAKEEGIKCVPSPTQARVVGYLSEHQGEDINQKDLENVFCISKAAISELLQSMENNGIIERVVSQKDARVKNIILTKEAINLFDDTKEIFSKVNNILIEGISDEELEQFFKILSKIEKNAERKDI